MEVLAEGTGVAVAREEGVAVGSIEGDAFAVEVASREALALIVGVEERWLEELIDAVAVIDTALVGEVAIERVALVVAVLEGLVNAVAVTDDSAVLVARVERLTDTVEVAEG